MKLFDLETMKTIIHVTITLENDYQFEGFDCRGRTKSLCDGCRLRFQCLSERDKVQIPAETVKRHKITDLRSMAAYMFGEGKIQYTIHEDKPNDDSGETKLTMMVEE